MAGRPVTPGSISSQKTASSAATSSRQVSAILQVPLDAPTRPSAEIAARMQRQGIGIGCVSVIAFFPFHIPAEFGARIGYVRPDRVAFWNSSNAGPLLPAGKAFHIAQHQRSATRSRALSRRKPSSRYARCSPRSTASGLSPSLCVRIFNLARIGLFQVAAQKIDGGVRGDPGKPVGGFLLVLQLILPLERLDKGLLGQILGIGDVPNDPVNLAP